MTATSPLGIQLSSASRDGEIWVQLTVKNTGPETVHLLKRKALPYLLKSEDGSLDILHGVNPPDPDINYFVIEIPPSLPLAPGESYETEFRIHPLILSDHYGRNLKPTVISGAHKIRSTVGWGSTPLTKESQATMTIHALLDWQNLVTGPEIELTFP